MIYLIDDNKYGQMSANYKHDYTKALRSFSGHVKWLQTILTNDIDIIISDASCILIHDSLDPKEDKERLVALAKKCNIPYCVFSNGFTATVFEGDSIIEIKKDRLYNNLLVFIDHFIADSIVDLKLLSLGKDYETEKAYIIQDRLINEVLFSNRVNFNYEVAFPSGSQGFKDLRELFYMSENFSDNMSYETAYNDFEDSHNHNGTTAKMIQQTINSLTNKVIKRYE